MFTDLFIGKVRGRARAYAEAIKPDIPLSAPLPLVINIITGLIDCRYYHEHISPLRVFVNTSQCRDLNPNSREVQQRGLSYTRKSQ